MRCHRLRESKADSDTRRIGAAESYPRTRALTEFKLVLGHAGTVKQMSGRVRSIGLVAGMMGILPPLLLCSAAQATTLDQEEALAVAEWAA